MTNGPDRHPSVVAGVADLFFADAHGASDRQLPGTVLAAPRVPGKGLIGKGPRGNTAPASEGTVPEFLLETFRPHFQKKREETGKEGKRQGPQETFLPVGSGETTPENLSC